MPSIQAAIVNTFLRLRRTFAPPGDVYDVPSRRAEVERLSALFKTPADVGCEPVTFKGIPAERLLPAQAVEGRLVLYLHGGYYNAGSTRTCRPLAAGTGIAARSAVLSLNYRLAPENPYPAALEDAALAYEGLLEAGHQPGGIVLAGESAGGGLVLGLLLHLKERKMPLPAAAVCYSPWTDLALTGGSYKENAASDLVTDWPSFVQSAQMYLQGADPRTPCASPLYGSLAGLPPLYIQAGSAEMLLSDATRFAGRAREAGVEVSLEIWPKMQHVWQLAAGIMPEADEAIRRAGAFVDRCLR